MLIIPEIKTVVILVRRTGSETLLHCVQRVHPQAYSNDRHLEADAVPQEYASWPKFGVVREPLERLWSLYLWLRKHAPMPPFEDWLFSEPEARRSQWHWLRPDLGTEIYQFTNQVPLYERLQTPFPEEHDWRHHEPVPPVPKLNPAAAAHIAEHHAWDMEQTKWHS